MADEDRRHQDETDDEKVTLEDVTGFAIVMLVLTLFALVIAMTGIDLT